MTKQFYPPKKRISFKICVFGDGGVGKTTLIKKYVTGIFSESTIMTIGVDFHVKQIQIDDNQVSLQIWDFAGEARFRFLLPTYVRGASGAIFMFDITRYSSLKNIGTWSEVIDVCTDEITRPLPIVLVGSKLDLAEKRAVHSDYGHQLKEENALFTDYIECSSLKGENVDIIFENLAREMLKRSGIQKVILT